jgi:integrase
MARSSIGDVMNYLPPVLHETDSRWYIDYYVKHPQTNVLCRKMIRLNRIKKISDRRSWARVVINELNRKLASGWNPFIEAESPKSFLPVFKAFDDFLTDKRNLRYDTLRVYHSEVKFLKVFIGAFYDEQMYASLFNKTMAIHYLDHVWATRNISALRYNNILAIGKLIFNWMITKGFTKTNPFAGIQKKKQGSKHRVMDIHKTDRKKIREYLARCNKPYHLMVMFAFNSLLRPKEICYMKIGDIDLKKQVIIVRGAVSKNGKTRYAPIPNVMIQFLKDHLKEVYVPRKNWFVFSKNYTPGPQRLDPRDISKYWSGLRATLKLKKEIQFYSLRDSGIIQMLRDGISPKEVMEAADHHSIEVTNVYIKVSRKESNVNVRQLNTKF